MVQNHKSLQRMSRSIDTAPEYEKGDELLPDFEQEEDMEESKSF